ncbi:MAG: two component signal transduction system response regulator with gyanylate cyclase domain [Bacteroidetes bacterium HLUCCA01]|nr:MAG: two component signal transduction system response regulator with gyanylate cyclase domain [Bacteroidetes bacterium HLUCCA01]
MLQSSGNILLIHDDEIRLADLRSQLVGHFNVFVAGDVRSAYRILREFDMHVVLAPEHTARMTGLQLAESIKGSFPDIVTIVQAGSSDYSALKTAVRHGRISHYLRSDADVDDIIQQVGNAMQLVQLREDNRTLGIELKKRTDEQQRILELFKRYVPEQVVAQTLSNGNEAMMVGENRIVSVLFADIRGFTRLSGQLRPAEVVEFLNDFWSVMSGQVRLHRGSVNKLLGDGMLAVFGAPVSYMDNQENAVICALEMVKALDEVNQKYSQRLGQDIQIGVGINTGEVVVGNVGSSDYMEYTVIGDTVNIAHRLEQMTKKRPNSILISQETWEQVNYLVAAEPVDHLQMAGKDKTITVYEVTNRLDANIKPMRRGGLGY